MKPLEISRLRLNRAKKHNKAISEIWNSIPDEELLSIRAKVDVPTGQGRIIADRVGIIPDECSLLLGEMLYQLRSALDGCIYQAVIYATGKNPPPDEGALEFPVCSDGNRFIKQAERRLSWLPQELQDFVEKLQPYNIPQSLPPEEMVLNLNRSLCILNDLARKDRHRKLHVIGAWPYRFNPEFAALPPNVKLHDLRIMAPGVLQNGSVLATLRLDGFRPGMNIQVNPRLRVQIGCDELPTPIAEIDTFEKRIAEMMNSVYTVVDAFENYF